MQLVWIPACKTTCSDNHQQEAQLPQRKNATAISNSCFLHIYH